MYYLSLNEPATAANALNAATPASESSVNKMIALFFY